MDIFVVAGEPKKEHIHSTNQSILNLKFVNFEKQSSRGL